MNNNRLLMVQSFRSEIPYTYMYKGLEKFRKILIKDNPELEKWAKKEFFQIKPIWPEKPHSNAYQYGTNVSGTFIAKNIDTPTTVMGGNCTPNKILKELKKAKRQGFPYTHVGFSVFIDSYNNFMKSAEVVKDFNKKIITIAGNVGALFEKTKNYVDYVCTNDGVAFFRKLLGEDIHKPYNYCLIPSKFFLDIFEMRLKSDLVFLTTKLGCPYQCDFCGTFQIFKGKCTSPFISPQDLYQALVDYHNQLKKDITIMFAEPTAVFPHKWWYELFDLFREVDADFPIIASTTPSSLYNFNFDKISKSSLRFQVINLGIESFNKNYTKNPSINDTKPLIKKLSDYGIGTLATYIIGFDYHNRENIWQEINRLIDLEASTYSVLNLKPIPKTPIWNTLKSQDRLLDIPYDLYYLQGFQSYLHPNFKPGFEDMLPLLCQIHAHIEKETSSITSSYIKLFETLSKTRSNKKFEKNLNKYKYFSKALYDSWESNLIPSEKQKEQYNSFIAEVNKIPLNLRLIKKSKLFRKVIQLLIH
ncbi:MAG: B12-binding domain-containing radical SAM protein [Promethearchaeota archaeon]